MTPVPPVPEEVDQEDSSAASSTTTSSNPFVGDTGSGFDPDHAGELPLEDEQLGAGAIALVPEIAEEQVRTFLKNGGDGAHALIGVGELDWVMTDVDQDRIAPPLTRIINKHEQLARLAGRSDELSLAVGAGLYTWRSLLEREAVLKAERRGRPVEQAAPAPPPAAENGRPDLGGMTVAEDYTPIAFRRPPEESQ